MIRSTFLMIGLFISFASLCLAQDNRYESSAIELFASSDTTEMMLFLDRIIQDSLAQKYSNPLIREQNRLPGDIEFYSVQESAERPDMAHLKQNFPNPFNPSTIFSYDLPEHSQIKIQIYDQLGRSVDVLINEPRIAGQYEFKYDASHLPSGVYIYRMEMKSLESNKQENFTRKFTLLK